MSQPQTSTFPNGSPSQLGTMVPQHGKEQPSLSIKQVVLLCERLWKEREEKLCEEYDQILNEKLGGNIFLLVLLFCLLCFSLNHTGIVSTRRVGSRVLMLVLGTGMVLGSFCCQRHQPLSL